MKQIKNRKWSYGDPKIFEPIKRTKWDMDRKSEIVIKTEEIAEGEFDKF